MVLPLSDGVVAQREQRSVVGVAGEVLVICCRNAGQDIEVSGNFIAEGLEGEIVDVVAEGVFDFSTDDGETEDNVGSYHGGRDSDPVEFAEELEGEDHDVCPCDLGDGNAVSEWQWGVENTFYTGQDVGHDSNVGMHKILAAGCSDRLVVNLSRNVGLKVSEDLTWEVAEIVWRSLDKGTGIGLAEGKTQTITKVFERMRSAVSKL